MDNEGRAKIKLSSENLRETTVEIDLKK